MITQLVACFIILISEKHIRWLQKNLSKQKVLDADPNEIQQINFTGNLDRVGDTAIFSYMKK